MKILFLTSSFNSMAQRLWIELDRLDHQVRVHVVQEEVSMEVAVEDFQPELIIAPYLRSKIPSRIWKNYLTWIVHPGPPGDRGASSLDWAIIQEKESWGTCILEAAEKMDSGGIWGYATFKMRAGSKASIYRQESTQASVKALKQALEHLKLPDFRPFRPEEIQDSPKGKWNPKCKQKDYAIDWNLSAEVLLKKFWAADSEPGVSIELKGQQYFAYGAHLEERLTGKAGEIIAKRHEAICIACGEKALWITHLKKDASNSLKLAASKSLGELADHILLDELDPFSAISYESFREIQYTQKGKAGYISFDFYNGAMNSDQCRRLKDCIQQAKQRDIQILVLMGGSDLWSNGIHLNEIEASQNPEDASWENILAIDDLIQEIILSPDQYIISAMRGNAGAGGVPMALAADKIFAREGIVLNPHTRQMGLFGSEYWTYLLPKRIGTEKATRFTEECLPWGTAVAKEIGLIDDVFGEDQISFETELDERVQKLAALPYFDKLLLAKKLQRRKDERVKPLESYRKEELEHMWKNFYENNWGYKEKRQAFVYKIPIALAQHSQRDWYSSRRKIYRRRKWESISYKE
ncbi:MAG: enoyl-CoA hydratase-related protein [Bacteroidia bacterium]|nr:enoyl-CoA hydratase-related protein [Bacteroidia bacterium]